MTFATPSDAEAAFYRAFSQADLEQMSEVWLNSPAAVFMLGAGFALCSLVLAFNVPNEPGKGNEVVLGKVALSA